MSSTRRLLLPRLLCLPLLLLTVPIAVSAGFTWTPVVSGLSRPVGIKHAGDSTGRLFILEQHLGRVRILNTTSGQLLAAPFLDLKAVAPVSSTAGEGGLLGIAFHPDFTQNKLFFVSYTRTDRTSVLARYKVSSTDANAADTSSEFIIMTVPQFAENHNGGDIHFGNDGLLYYSLGDGGGGGDPQRNGQNPNTLLAKILRIDINSVSQGKNYSVPTSNVLRNEGFVWGLRNPWRFSFDRLTGDLWIGDVGQGSYEEIDFKKANASKLFTTNGENYGWNNKEGFAPYPGGAPANGPLTDPIAAYNHSTGSCSVTGGFVYRGREVKELVGAYIYGDFCTGDMYKIVNGTVSQLPRIPSGLTTFGEDQEGGLYHCLLRGQCFRLATTDPLPKLAAVLRVFDINGGQLIVGDRVNVSITITNIGNATQFNNNGREFNMTFPHFYLNVRDRLAEFGRLRRNREKSLFWWNGRLLPGQSVRLTIFAIVRQAGRFCFSGVVTYDAYSERINSVVQAMTGTLCYTARAQ